MDARPRVIDSREHLIHVLTEAAEIEHNLLCSYLYAVFSLKREAEARSTAQGEAVERWRKTILSVALEEMAHLASVNNLLLAVGGAPHLDRPNLPVPPGYHPAGLVARLTPFDAATLDHFIYLERPEGHDRPDGAGFEPLAVEREALADALTPSAFDYDTIGVLYDALGAGFERLAGRLGEAVLIDPRGRGQLCGEAARLAGVEPVTSLAGARAAIEQIKEQGEGSSGRRQDSHYDRFLAIKREWAELARDDPGFQPAWPAAADPVMRRPAEGIDRVWVTEADAARQLDFGNAVYGAMLTALSQVFGRDDRETQARLMTVAIQLMEVVAGVGSALARMPANAERPDANAGFTFAVPRNVGLRPGFSTRTLLERLEELRSRAGAVLDGEQRRKALDRLDRCITAAAG